MTKSEFEKLPFDEAVERLGDENSCVTTYEALIEYIIKCLRLNSNILALHLLDSVVNSDGDSEYYYYDYSCGTLCTPVCLNSVEDVESFIGFDKE